MFHTYQAGKEQPLHPSLCPSTHPQDFIVGQWTLKTIFIFVTFSSAAPQPAPLLDNAIMLWSVGHHHATTGIYSFQAFSSPGLSSAGLTMPFRTPWSGQDRKVDSFFLLVNPYIGTNNQHVAVSLLLALTAPIPLLLFSTSFYPNPLHQQEHPPCLLARILLCGSVQATLFVSNLQGQGYVGTPNFLSCKQARWTARRP